ncbi:hypothetical protein SAMN03080598_02498 [Algoriphagus boritolerans DSM 17298 = JCM 18970]|uniref:Uncharacterized protein n=1 Tax=Algoriphagus boritolerans DSM 17298 = JCM 18970 TaxID=1120964 RepID=A0A1H5XG26_9BACT|nr:hypothetical protein SAMN03080598_02498 [Algoriphagus boritolerans DSM 17298 = JCM 18970]
MRSALLFHCPGIYIFFQANNLGQRWFPSTFFTPGCHPGLLRSSTTPWSILGLADSTIPEPLNYGQFIIQHSSFNIQHSTFIIHHSSFIISNSTFNSSSAPTSHSSPYHCAEVNGLLIFFTLGSASAPPKATNLAYLRHAFIAIQLAYRFISDYHSRFARSLNFSHFSNQYVQLARCANSLSSRRGLGRGKKRHCLLVEAKLNVHQAHHIFLQIGPQSSICPLRKLPLLKERAGER